RRASELARRYVSLQGPLGGGGRLIPAVGCCTRHMSVGAGFKNTCDKAPSPAKRDHASVFARLPVASLRRPPTRTHTQTLVRNFRALLGIIRHAWHFAAVV